MQGFGLQRRFLVVLTLLSVWAVVLPAARGQEGLDEPELPPGTVTVLGEFTSGKFLDPGERATSPDQTLIYSEYELVDHGLVFWVLPPVGGEPTAVIGYGEVAQRHEWELEHPFTDQEGNTSRERTRRAFTTITEMDFDGTWDGNDPGQVEGTVTWTVPEDRVDVEWNEWTVGTFPSATTGIFTGAGPDGVFTATWSPSAGEMSGVIDTGPWDGGFEAFAVPDEPPATPESSTTAPRPKIPCFFDTAPDTTPACEGEGPAQGSGLGLIGALTESPMHSSEGEELIARVSEGEWVYEIPAGLRGALGSMALAFAQTRPNDLSVRNWKHPFPVFEATAPLFRALVLAEKTAKNTIEDQKARGAEPTQGEIEALARVQRTTLRLFALTLHWELNGFMPGPIGGS